MHRKNAFTLVELLIVVAIVAILASIGVVNFLEAQVRGKVARVQSDMRTMMVALESYRTDHSAYPPAYVYELRDELTLNRLSTPIAYITTTPVDPFGEAPFDFNSSLTAIGYDYIDKASTSTGMPAEIFGPIWPQRPGNEYFVHSCGPNKVWDVAPYQEYDPTNSSVSLGDITKFGP